MLHYFLVQSALSVKLLFSISWTDRQHDTLLRKFALFQEFTDKYGNACQVGLGLCLMRIQLIISSLPNHIIESLLLVII